MKVPLTLAPAVLPKCQGLTFDAIIPSPLIDVTLLFIPTYVQPSYAHRGELSC